MNNIIADHSTNAFTTYLSLVDSESVRPGLVALAGCQFAMRRGEQESTGLYQGCTLRPVLVDSKFY